MLLATGKSVAGKGAGKEPQGEPRRRADRPELLDRGIPLLTRDRDFRAFAETAGLDLVLGAGTH